MLIIIEYDEKKFRVEQTSKFIIKSSKIYPFFNF